MTAITTPIDDSTARARAIAGLDVSMTLAAGAGSGKTSVLVQRVLGVLRSGVDPGTVAAITFTDKAAGELRARVRDALERGAEHGGVDDDATDHVARALSQFGNLTITTIHAFCAELLRAEALEAAFAPGTSVGDDEAAHEALLGALSSWREELLHRKPQVRRLIDDGATFSQLLKAAGALVRLRDHRPIVSDVVFDLEVARAELGAVAASIAAAAEHCAAPDTCKLIKGNASLVAMIDDAADNGDPGGDRLLGVLWSDKIVRKSGGTKGDWGDHRLAYIEAITGLGDWRIRWQGAAHGEVVRDLLQHLVPRVLERKQAASIATFDDLLSETARLLRTSPGARARLASRARVLLIDEVQDTDPLQAEIATLLTSARDAISDGDGDDDTTGDTDAGRLFVVGDPRQSIYRFRGADVDTFQRLQQHVGDVGESHTLTTNFRSVPSLVAWVNHTFQTLPGYVDQVARRPAATLDPVVVIEAGGDDDQDGDDGDGDGDHDDDGNAEDGSGGADVSDVDDETLAVIAHLQGLMAEGATVVDRDTGLARPLRPTDVMILLPAWRKADAIADALRAHGLPAIVEGGDTFFRRDEVRLGVCALRALVEPGDTEATAMVLRGLFGLSLEAMAAHVAAGGSLRFTLPVTVPGPVGDALGLLSTLHRQRGRTSLPVLLDGVLAGARTLGVWALLPDRDARLANLDKLKAMVRDLEKETTSPLQAVNALLDRQRNAADKDIDRLDDDGDAVRITSLFKAKGLEAPVVVLMAMNRTVMGPEVIVDHVAVTAAVRLSERLLPAGWAALVALEKARNLEERRRWMYVAATRARDQLVVCRTLTRKKDAFVPPNLLAHDLARGLPPVPSAPTDDDGAFDNDDDDDGGDTFDGVEDGACWSPDDAPDVVVKVRLASSLLARATDTETFPGHDDAIDALLRAPPGVGDPDGEAWATSWKQRTRAAERACLRWRRASNERGSARLDPGRPAEVPADVGGGSSASVGARVGRVVHAVMERLDLSQPAAGLQDVAKDLVDVLSSSAMLSVDEARATGHIVRRILSHPALKDVQQAPERWHEVPFTVTQQRGAGPASVVAGTIDLCFPVDVARTRWVVIDWKSKVPGPGTALRAKYEAQLMLYARALLHTMDSVVSIDDVQTAIVGPYPELQAVAAAAGEVDGASAVDEVLLDAPANLRPFLTQLLDSGHEVPELDADLDEALPGVGDVVFRSRKVALVQDAGQIDDDTRATLSGRGWRLVDTVEALVAAMGPGPDEQADADSAGTATAGDP